MDVKPPLLAFDIIAVKYAQAIVEVAIAALCAAVICFSLIPPLAPQQTLIGQDSVGQTTEFLLPADDPRVVALAQQWEEYNDVRPSSEFAMASWKRDLAEHYLPKSQQGRAVTDTTTDAAVAIWQKSKQEADQLVSETRHAMYRNREPAPALRLGEIRYAMMPTNAIWFALACGLVAGCVFWKWGSCYPVKRTGELVVYGPADASGNTHMSSLVSKPNWFRIAQPISVKVRRSALAVLVACAAFCVVN